tara:strand:- start:1731 stop:2090 length:360 start_codon:yes stop_codon:yes gene_type:complete
MLRESSCSEHGLQKGEEDLRLRFVLDNGASNANLFLGKEPAEEFLEMSMQDVKDEVSSTSSQDFVSRLQSLVLGRKMLVHGRCSVDGQGAMVFAERAEIIEQKPAEEAEEVMKRWGLVL